MDYNLSEDQVMLKTSAREFLTKECPKKIVREILASDTGYSPELWNKMAELGWLGLAFPEEYGGTGYSFLDLIVLLEEMGYNTLPSPFFSTIVLGGMAVLEFGTEDQKKEILGKISNGKLIMSLAFTEKDGKFDPASIATKAVLKNDQYEINGIKLFVTDAEISNCLLVAARTHEMGSPSSSLSLFLVDTKTPGIEIKALKTMIDQKLYEVHFKGVKCPATNILGKAGQGWPIIEKLLKKASIAKCAEMVGGTQAVLDMSVQYAKERIQFGKPIGSYQAIQHHCANMVIDLDGSRFITYKAAWTLNQGLDSDLVVSMAKAWTSDAFKHAASLGHQIFGAISFTLDHDLHFYLRDAKYGGIAYGNADYHRSVIAHCMGIAKK